MTEVESADSSKRDSNFFKQMNQIIDKLGTSPREEDYTVTFYDIFYSILSIFFRIIGILININVAYEYFRHGKQHYFIWTVSCFAIPMVITSFLQIAM